jgi:hypothetical protein
VPDLDMLGRDELEALAAFLPALKAYLSFVEERVNPSVRPGRRRPFLVRSAPGSRERPGARL